MNALPKRLSSHRPREGLPIRQGQGTMLPISCRGRISFCLALTGLAVASSAGAADAGSQTTRAQYAAELHRVDAPLMTLYDTFYAFQGGRLPVSWATKRTVSAQQALRQEVRRLSALTPPRPVARQHPRILAALKRLASDLQKPISLAPRGKTAVLNWWLQDFGALPEIFSLNALHKTVSNAGYWP